MQRLRAWRAVAAFIFIATLAAKSTAHQAQATAVEATINVAAPGSYVLPILRAAADGEVRNEHGIDTTIHALLNEKLSVLSFIYTHCADAKGCPLASYTLGKLAARITNDPELAPKVRLVSVSFDPARDTPIILAEYAANFRHSPAVDWQFVVPTNQQSLTQILSGYNQVTQRDANGDFSHQLRVFLIDTEGNIRNEYSAGFLNVAQLYADLKTLTLPPPLNATSKAPAVIHAGDDKVNYTTANYITHSRALSTRQGSIENFLANLAHLPLGLPAMPGNKPTTEQIELGRTLFFDRRLSHNDTIACASCHIPEQGFTNQELTTPVGIEGRSVRRNAPSLYNVGYQQRLFHDARESTLLQQVWSPLLAANEMGNPSIGYVLDKLSEIDRYAERFKHVFGSDGITMQSLGAALAAYEKTLVSANSAFDRWYFKHDQLALNTEAQRGFELFRGKAGCVQCHRVGVKDALFTDQQLHNTGLGYRKSMRTEVPATMIVSPGNVMTLAPEATQGNGVVPSNDLGRYEITHDPADRWRYKTPSLRNVALTQPYMHDGSLPTLRAVVEFYNRGGIPNDGLDPLIKPLGLGESEINALVEFLNSLTGDNVDVLTRDAFATPIGDRHR